MSGGPCAACAPLFRVSRDEAIAERNRAEEERAWRAQLIRENQLQRAELDKARADLATLTALLTDLMENA